MFKEEVYNRYYYINFYYAKLPNYVKEELV